MNNYIIGTAGHVDHGKSALIKALTGTDPDRLPEEKARGLTLDLGFAHLTLSNGIECGIVDVPGHEKYLKNMLAGVGGYDFALLVIDAGEGIMEQTREHLEIMELLEIKDGLTVITKIDRVEPEFVDMVEEEVVKFLKDTFLHDSPIARVSAFTGEGIESLRYLIEQRIVRIEPRSANTTFRLPIDRKFVKSGFGTVVTGTVFQGAIEVGDRVHILPSGTSGKVRQIQVNNEKVGKVVAGQRAALNIAGVDAYEIYRGDQVITPGTARATGRMDATVKVLTSSLHPLKNRTEVRLYVGATEVFAKVILLDRDELNKGEECFAQIVFEESITVFNNDKFIIRGPSAIYTIGGGTVLEPYPRKHRRYDKKALEILELKKHGDPVALLNKVMSREPLMLQSVESISGMISLPPQEIGPFIAKMKSEGDMLEISDGKMILSSIFKELEDKTLALFRELEENEYNRLGTRPEELKLNLPKMEDRLFRELLIHLKSTDKMKEKNGLLSRIGFYPRLDEDHQKCYEMMIKEFKQHSFKPPSIEELVESTGFSSDIINNVLQYLLFRNELVKISENIYFLNEQIEKARKKISGFIVENKGITPSEARKLLDSTRKYIIPLLEYFDRTYFTVRKDNKRVLMRKSIFTG